MNWEGFARSLQGDLMYAFGCLFVIIVVYFLVSYKYPGTEELYTRKAFAKIAITATVFVLSLMVIRAIGAGLTNRMPRQDVNKQPVYEQMDSHN